MPAIIVKTEYLKVKRAGMFVVAMRNMRPGPNHGQWEVVSTSGFWVLCPSYLMACELVWMVGGRHFERPVELIHDDDHDEERYLNWLLEHWFKISPHTAGEHPLEVMFSEFIRGWVPSADDLLRPHGLVTSERREEALYRGEGRATLVASALTARLSNR